MQLLSWLLLGAALIALNWRFLRLDRLMETIRSSFSRPCKWRLDPMMRGGSYGRYQCRACGAEAFTSDGRAPRVCKRAARSIR